jgi:HEAT repeat protein
MSKDNRSTEIRCRKSGIWRRLLTRWLISRLQIKSVEIRTYILQALGKVGDKSAIPILLHAAKDTDNTIRRFAVSALADFGDTETINAIIDALNDLEADIRATAAMSLGLLGDMQKTNKNNPLTPIVKGESINMRVEDALIERLGDKDISVRSQAIIALGNLRSSKAFSILSQMTSTESNEWIRRYISQAILEIKGGYR